MRRLEKPDLTVRVVFEKCMEGVMSDALRTKFESVKKDIVAAAVAYEGHGVASSLYKIKSFKGGNHEIVTGAITKGELKSLYSKYLVEKSKPARSVYDQLLNAALQKTCPICGFGYVKRLDHYLPKSKYPLLSVAPQNLVPACRDCNMEKLAAQATDAGQQPLHPYYDAEHFYTEQWLFAEVVQTSPATVTFYVDPPADWDEVSQQRVQCHFDGFTLSERFAVQVSTDLSAIKHQLSNLNSANLRREHLLERAETYMKVHVNSWQTALSQALANDDWYCQIGYLA